MRRRRIDAFSLSFLDCICCGFGGIVLLLCMVKIYEPSDADAAGATFESAPIERDLDAMRAELASASERLEQVRGQLELTIEQNAVLAGDLSKIRGQFAASRNRARKVSEQEGELALALQTLTEEMKRLYGENFEVASTDSPVGGIPIDSEYVIFVIDTSGSMHGYAWSLVQQKMSETLDLYPQVKGVQIMNDMGSYMFTRYDGRWIPDTPTRRKIILERLETWAPFSNSSPIEGIRAAVKTFYAPDRKISVYVFGDDFAGGSLQSVVDAVDRINQADESGELRVRIHAVGFPVQFLTARTGVGSGVRFAHLMRTLCERNGGTFVGLPNLKVIR